MKLSNEDSELFYKIYYRLLFFANKRYKIIENLTDLNFREQDMELVAKLDQKVFSNPEIINSFVSENPFLEITKEEMEIVKSWMNFIKGEFYLITHLKDYSIFFGPGDEKKAYGVVGIETDLKQMFPFEPIMMDITLLPFKGKIIYSSFFRPYDVFFGGGIKKSLNRSYQEAKNKYDIITSLDEPIQEKEDSKINTLKYYLKSESNRWEYEGEINKILKENPELINIYYQEISKSNSRSIKKNLNNCDIYDNTFFAVLGDNIIASGNDEDDVKKQLHNILPKDKHDRVFIFKYKGKRNKLK